MVDPNRLDTNKVRIYQGFETFKGQVIVYSLFMVYFESSQSLRELPNLYKTTRGDSASGLFVYCCRRGAKSYFRHIYDYVRFSL